MWRSSTCTLARSDRTVIWCVRCFLGSQLCDSLLMTLSFRKLWLIPLGAGRKNCRKTFFFLNIFVKSKTLNGNMSPSASFKTGMCQNKCFYFDLRHLQFLLYLAIRKQHIYHIFIYVSAFLDNCQKWGTACFQSEFLAFLFRDFQFLAHDEGRYGCSARITYRWEPQHFRFSLLALACFL